MKIEKASNSLENTERKNKFGKLTLPGLGLQSFTGVVFTQVYRGSLTYSGSTFVESTL